MPWSPGPTDPKYRSPEHRAYRESLVRELHQQGFLTCTADVCVFDDRTITNPDGRAPDGLHAGHEDNGVDYRGPQHRDCNVRDGAVRARAKQANPGMVRWSL